jgi:DNA-3-methyladenine glycosylase II
MPRFEYGTREMDYLKSRDRKLGEVIDRMGVLECEVIPDPFAALIFSIVGQQISSKAADTVWNRLQALVGDMTPEAVLMTDHQAIQSCGMTHRKAGYIQGIAEAICDQRADFQSLHNLSDRDVIRRLSELPGVGPWTAEMLLIFSLHRYDVVSFDDLAIRRGMMTLYGLDSLTKEQFQRYRKRYSPYGSVASLYLWELSLE